MTKSKLVIDTKKQVAELYKNNTLVKTFVVSTAANGVGCEEGSLCTPSGKLKVAQKVGEGLPLGTVIRSRIPTGEVWSSDPQNPLAHSQEDFVLTRLLWLEGVEPHNKNTFDRYIYLHGTNHEHLLGKPASHGCIRFSNADIVEVFDLLKVGDEVVVV